MKNTAALLLAWPLANAEIVANYDLATITDDNPEVAETFLSPSIDAEPNSVASDLTSPSTHGDDASVPVGTINPEFGDPLNNGGNPAIGWSGRGINPAAGFSIYSPVDTDFTFDLTPNALSDLEFTSLSLTAGVFSGIGGTTAYDYTLLYSLDGSVFTPVATVAAGTNPGDAPIITTSTTATATISFDLTGVVDLQSQAGQVYFKLDVEPAAGASTNGVQSQRAGFIDDLTVEATVNTTRDPIINDPGDTDFTDDGSGVAIMIPITNDGSTQNLSISAVNLTGPDAADFGPAILPSDISPGNTDTIELPFTPNGSGTYEVDLEIVSNDPLEPSVTLTLTGEVTDPLIDVDTSVVNFGSFPASPGLQTTTLTIGNLGGGAAGLTLADTSEILGDAGFSIVTPLPLTITAGGSTDIEIGFDPSSDVGRFNATLFLDSDDYFTPTQLIPLTARVEPSGTIVARFDFDPAELSGSTLDLDGSAATDWTTGDLTDAATGNGALGASNQAAANRDLTGGLEGNFLRLSSNREGDAQTPLAAGGNDESTWSTTTVAAFGSGGSIDFTGGIALVDTYAFTNLGSNTAADWTLYYSTDGGATWTSLGTSSGAATSDGLSLPIGLSWDLSTIGNATVPVTFLLDPVSTGGTNGSAAQRSIGFDNFLISAASVTAGTAGFADWATGEGIPNDPTYDATDKDGIPALVEYALGLSPSVTETLADTFDPATGTLSFDLDATALANGDITVVIEESDDLGVTDPWATVATDTAGNIIEYTLPTGQPKVFARLNVTQNP
ncbi:hypothetical protein HAHE_00290 [Haloferula helveola]|uniref:HYDIN/VesB/CFA65-like Ig-like domain-containing protein n=1 Tax=Haloferula helveola TaxID=490095 RepID=A0ABM7RBZ5_9BACT|nr:hypothetical protein HAHE_00290 [Haloferula helveola]